MKSRRRLWIAGLLCSIAAQFAEAQPPDDRYPSRPVRMIIPFSPGGASDFVGRIIQHGMAALLAEQVVVDNRPGAAGNIGVQTAARATPDGYTFLLGNVGTIAVNPNFYTKFAVKPAHDLMPVTQVVDVPGCLVVNPSLPVTTVADLVAYLKSNPGKINYGSPAPSSANALEMQMFLNNSGTKAMQIPYKGGAGPATIGLLGNEVQMMFVTLSSAITFVKQNQLRLLAVIAPARVDVLPDAPTMREQGYDMVVGSWQGIFLPRDTPQDVVRTLFRVGRTTMQNPDIIKRLSASGVSVVISKSPADFAAFTARESARFARVIKDAHIPTD
jgi:tripartite-type tricarboxylate transporter receptor subunit TctC